MIDVILNLIPGGGLTTLFVSAGTLILAILAGIGLVSRKSTIAERNRNLAMEAKRRDEQLERIKLAGRAKPVSSVLDDKNNRDNR